MRIKALAYFYHNNYEERQSCEMMNQEWLPDHYYKALVSFPINEDVFCEEVDLRSKSGPVTALRIYFDGSRFYDIAAKFDEFIPVIETNFGKHIDVRRL